MAGRKKDPIWIYFKEKNTISGKGVKAICKSCNIEMMGIVARMRKHKEICSVYEENDSEPESVEPKKEEKGK